MLTTKWSEGLGEKFKRLPVDSLAANKMAPSVYHQACLTLTAPIKIVGFTETVLYGRGELR